MINLKKLPPLLTAAQAAQLLNRSAGKVRKECHEGTFIVEPVKLGNEWRIPTRKLLRAVGLDDHDD
jgi:hypothetical protein